MSGALSAYRRIILTTLGAGFFLAGFLLPIGSAATQQIPIEPLPPDVVIETFLPHVENLVAMDFTPDGRLLYTERVTTYWAGSYLAYLRVVVNGQLLPDPVYAFPVLNQGEQGLLGITVDPNFAVNHYVWVYLSKYSSNLDCGSNYKNRVVRFQLNDNNTINGEPETMGCYPIVSQYETIHNGGNLHFGPDGKLYIAVGNNDSTNDSVDPAQNLNSPLGKVHRVNPGPGLSAPADNPFAGNTIYAYGLRNPFDFDFDPVSGQIFATENGDACDDEINRLLPGGNYGWRPNYPCDDAAGPHPVYNTLPPLIYWSPSIAPTGLTFYRGTLIPEWKNDLFMCAFKDSSTAVHHFKLNAARTAIISHTILAGTKCRTDLMTGPDGAVYYAEEGGYYHGPLKRLTRRTSFAVSQVGVIPAVPRSGDVVTYALNVRHLGTITNTFTLIAALPPQATLQALGSGLTFDGNSVSWSRSLAAMQNAVATFTVRLTDTVLAPYLLTLPVTITAPDTQPVNLTSLVIVNGWGVYLPLVYR